MISRHHGAGKSVAVLNVLTLFFLNSAKRPRYLANDLTEIDFDMGFLALYQISQVHRLIPGLRASLVRKMVVRTRRNDSVKA